MSKTKVAFCIPTYGSQPPEWWAKAILAVVTWTKADIEVVMLNTTSAMPDISKNQALAKLGWNLNAPNDKLTSSSRNQLVAEAEAEGPDPVEWIFWWDHDTEPQADVLLQLLALQKPFVAGVYYHRNAPHQPLTYRRTASGLYTQLKDFEHGALMEVDATGMGCTLIHREVYDAIRREHVVLQRQNGTLFLVHREDFSDRSLPRPYRPEGPKVYGGKEGGLYFVEPLRTPSQELIDRIHYPFYEMEHGRTEDFGFCEKARRAGYEIYVDTSIETNHWQLLPITHRDFESERNAAKITGEMSPVIRDERGAS